MCRVRPAARSHSGRPRAAVGEHDDTSGDLQADGRAADAVSQLRQDADVLAAFAQLREAPSILLRESPDVERERRAVRGNVVVPDVHLRLPGLSESVRYLRDVDLVALLELCRGIETWVPCMQTTRAVGAVALPDFLGALSVLACQGRSQACLTSPAFRRMTSATLP